MVIKKLLTYLLTYLLDSLLLGSTVGYPSDSSASCYCSHAACMHCLHSKRLKHGRAACSQSVAERSTVEHVAIGAPR